MKTPAPPVLASVILTLLSWVHSGSSHAEILASTHADFSTAAQGTNGFSYGYYPNADSTAGAFESSLMESRSDSYGPYWVVDPNGSQTPSLNRNNQHPGISLLPVVRRYVVGASGESSFTGTVRIVGRFFDLNYGATNVFIAVDPDGDGPTARTLLLPSMPMANSPISFNLSTTVAPGTTIDFGTLAMGSYDSDSTGLAAWIVTNDSAVPTNVVAPLYHSTDFPFTTPDQDFRGLAFVQATDAIVTAADVDCFDTSPGGANHPYQFAGLLYLESSGSGMATLFDQVRINMGTEFSDGGDFAEMPRLFLLRHNSDPASNNPVADERYALLPVVPVKSTNTAGRPVYTFDTSALPASQRTGYGFAIVGPGSGSNRFISVSEIGATATRVADSGLIAPQPAWVDYNGHRYGRSLTQGTWEQCEAEAVSYGGHLVSLNSAQENEWVLSTFGRTTDFYIGLKQNTSPPNVEPRGGWSWLDGTAVTDAAGADAAGLAFVNWESGEPNNFSSPGEEYGMIFPSHVSGRTTWADVRTAGYPETSNYRGIIELPTPGTGTNLRVIVPGTANIYGAGADLRSPADSTTPTVNGGGTGGTASPFLNLPTGAGTIRFSSVTGSVSVSGASELQNIAPDGGTPYSTIIAQTSGYNGHAGIVNGYGGGFLTGVFVDADGAVPTLPPALDFSSSAKGQNFVSLAPKLNQPFFIGDGLTSSGTGDQQQFHVPAGATRLYLGIADAYNGTPFQNASGVGAYQDNGGAFDARFTVSLEPVITNESFPATGGAFDISGGLPPYQAITVSAGSLPPGITISGTTVQGRPTEEGTYAVTLRTEDAASVQATKAYTLNIPAASSSLIAWWKGDVDALDSAGDHDGTFTGGTASASLGGVVGSGSFAFSGSHLVTVPHAEELNLNGDFTIEGWMKRETANGLEATIISKRNSDNQIASYVFYILTDGRLSFASRSPSNPGDGWAITTASATLPADSVWRHLAVTCSGTEMRFFVNGALVHTGTHPARVATTAPVTIGGYSVGGNNSGDWPGRIDELSLYSRALKASEISAVFAAESLGKVIRVKPAITDDDFLFTGGQLTIEGGTGPFAVTVQSGTLPSGTTVSSTGLVSGTSLNGPYSFTLRVTDALNRFTDRVFSGLLSNPVPAPAGLVAQWPGDNTVADIIGDDHLSLVNNATFGPGKVGRAFQFNGTDQSLQSATATDVMKHLPLTIEGWIKPEARTTGNLVSYLPTNVIANDQVNFGGHGFGAHLYPDGSMFKVGIEGATEDFRTVPGVTFTDGEWVHVAVVYSVGNVKTYLNGVLKDDYSFTQGALNGGDTIRVGRHNDDTGFGSLRFFKGAIDELSLYHRALSLADVGLIYSAGAGGKARHDAARDYSTTTKDGPVWSYRWLPSTVSLSTYDPDEAKTRLLATNNGFDGNGIHTWIGDAYVSFNPKPTEVLVDSGGYRYTWLPQQLGMGPNSSDQRSVVRWKAPQSGVYAVSGTFYGADTRPTTVDVHIFHNSTQLSPSDKRYVDSYRGNGVSHTQLIEAAENDTVDFVVGVGGNDWHYDSTGLTAFVTRVGNIIPTTGNGIAAWGQGANGALGNSSTLSELSPVPVSMDGALYGKTIAAVAGGLSHSLALDTTGKVYAWGINNNGQLGEGSTNQRTTARAVTTTGALSGKTVTRIAACEGISFAVTSDGQLITWGKSQPASFTVTPIKQTTPVRVTGSLATKTVSAVACGTLHSLALTSDGEIHAWGINHAGQLGNGTTTGRDVPAKMTTTGTALSGKTVTAIAVVGASSFALTSEGKVYAWGLNDFGQLGDGSTANRSLPVLIGGLLSGKTITAISSGAGRHQLALASDGSLFAWGDNAFGQLGNGTTTASNTPTAVTMSGALSGLTVANVYAGADYSLVRTNDGKLFTWGADVEGQIGDGVTAGPSLEPVAVDATTSLSGQFVVAASAGATHALAVTAGTAVQEIVVRDPSNADIADGSTVNLGNQAVGTPAAPLTYTIRNAGAAPLTITSVTLSGGESSDFGLNASGAIGSIDPGNSRTFSISFTAGALGARSTTVNVVSDDADEATFDFTLTGTGAADATPPTLEVVKSWVEKASTKHDFKFLLDARDNVGINKIQVRSKINSTAALPDATPWVDWTWRRDEPVIVSATCTSIVVELRALDAAGNASPIQRRIFKTPFPLGTAPSLAPKFVSDSVFTGSTIDCRGLFGADFDGDGRDDILQIDRITGQVKINKQQSTGTFVPNEFFVGANAVTDSAIGDFDDDGKPDIAIVINGVLGLYHNDGPNGSNALQFSLMSAAGLATTGISTVVGVAVGDVTGEGKDDILISGTGDDGAMGTVAKIAVLINNGQFQLGASNNARAFPTSSAGSIRLGDVTGDGWTDAVMIDAANNQVLLFINKRNGSFGGADDTDSAARPQATVTDDLPPQALAVGDVTGDGRADVVVTLHTFEALDGVGTERDNLLGQLLDSRGASPLHANPPFLIGQGDLAASGTTFRSDVILQDMNGDRFPEAIFTNPFEAGSPKGGVRALRFTCLLDNTNTLSSVAATAFGYATGAPDPHRLASARFGLGVTKPDILLASGGSEQVQWIFSTYTELSKTYDLATTAFTERDATGTVDTNGLYTYETDIGGLVSYSISYVNNATTAITGGIVECVMPSTLSVESGDAGYTVGLTGKSKYIRWTQDIPAGSSGVKRFTARVSSGATADAAIAPTANLKKGTTVLVTKPMPKVVLRNPLELTVTTISDTDPRNGLTARLDDYITYRMKVKNRGTGPITGFSLGMSIPANTTLISGTSPPNPVLVGTFPNYVSATWTNLTVAGGDEFTYDLRVQVKSTVTNGTIIKNSTITLTRAAGQKLVAPAINTTILPTLEITLKSNKNIVQPGDIIRYTFTVRNLRNSAVTNAKVVDKLPTGVSLLTAGVNDNMDAPDGKGNFVYSTGTWTAAQLATDTLPAFDRSTGIMTWALGTVPANAQRDIEFDVIVAQDIPTFYNTNGVSVTQEIQNKSYNFVATSSTGTRLFAATAVGGTAANALTATSDKLLSTSLPARRSLLSDPPLAAPKMVLVKSAFGDGETYIGGEKIAAVINDPDVPTDGLYDYRLSFANFGGGTAVNVMVRDYLPDNTAISGFEAVFDGQIRRNGAPITSVVGYRFYDAAGNKLTMFSPETFTDSDGDGLYDLGEPYTDSNSNGKYDDITGAPLSSVRSIEFPAGDVLSGIGGNFTYRTKTVLKPGNYITSDAGGMTGVKDGLTYTQVKGYHLTADNLHFPVNGSPKQVKVNVVGPATFNFPAGVIQSRNEMVGTEITEITIPWEIVGGDTLTLSGVKMTVAIPKGYLVTGAIAKDNSTPTATTSDNTTTVKNSAGVTTVSFFMPNSFHNGNAIFYVQLDPATKSVLKGTDGAIKSPLVITPTLSGGYLKAGKLTPLGSVTRPALGSLPVLDVVVPPPQAAPVPGQTAPPPSYGDAKIFVGRCAPVSVKRGDTFGITIFVGNLTNLPLGVGTIEMNVPAGCDYVDASHYRYNTPGVTPSSDTGGTFGLAPKRSGAKVIWQIGGFAGLEGGAVTLSVKVREDFSGTRIDDNSCIFDVVNASGKTPGPLGIVVRTGNEATQSSEIAMSAASALGMNTSDGVRDALAQAFTLGAASCTIATGGTDLVQILNGVAVIQLGGGRVLNAGPPDKIVASGIRLVKDDAMMRVAVGPGNSGGVQLTKLPTFAPGFIQPTNTMLANLQNASSSLVAAQAANIVAAGGGNLVAAGGGNLVAAGGGNLVGPDGGTIAVAPLVAAGGGNLVAAGGGNLVAAGGGNLVAAGGGNIVAAGGGNLLNSKGNSLVAAGGGNLVVHNGSSLVAAGGGNIVAAGGGNIVAAGGMNLIPNK